MEFENTVVLITGGGSGIGKAAATRFLAEGAKVVINGRDSGKLKDALTELDASGASVDAVAGDYVQVPSFTVHRESNPGREPSLAVIARAGSGIPTVNVPFAPPPHAPPPGPA